MWLLRVSLLVLLVMMASAADLNPPDILTTDAQTPNAHSYGCPSAQGQLSLAWAFSSSLSGSSPAAPLFQTRFQVQVVTADDHRAVDDSGWVTSRTQRYYPGTLPPASTLCWRVRVGLSNDTSATSPYSACLPFDTAPDDSVLERGEWIGGHGQLRGDFEFPTDASHVTRARMYATGVGAFYAFVNGERVGDDIMSPPQSVYHSRVLYTTYNVTQQLVQSGGTKHTVGVLLGNVKWGYTDLWCNMTTAGGPDGCRAFRMVLVVEFDDGKVAGMYTTGATDLNKWRARPSPVTWDHLFHGETYNASQALEGWAMPSPHAGAADASWAPATQMQPPGTGLGALSPVRMPPIRAVEHFQPQSIDAVAPNVWLYDFGQNMAGLVTLQLPTETAAGTVITFAHAEMRAAPHGPLRNGYCNANPASPPLRLEPCAPHQTYGPGHLIEDRYVGDFNCANGTNIYIAAGGAATYTPYFSYAGFRFVQLAAPSLSVPPNLTAHFSHTDVREVGFLRAADVPATGINTSATPDVLNGIHRLTRYAQLSNLWSIPTDCPQRERRGWMGDAQVSSDGAMRMLDMHAFYRTFLDHIRDDQLWGCASTPDHSCPADKASGLYSGSLADVVPYDGIGGWPGCPVWQVAYIVIAHHTWRHYGDQGLLANHYPGLKMLLDYFERNADAATGLLDTACYGDWIDAGNKITPPGSVSAFYYVLAYQYMHDIAAALGNEKDAAAFASQFDAGRSAYHRAYFNATAGGYSAVDRAPRGSQTSNAMALAINAPPDAATRKIVEDALIWDVQTLWQNHTSSGIVGQAWVTPMLAAAGRGDLALAMLRADTVPSFGNMLANNQTTLCESWSCNLTSPTGSSHNHIMFGAFDAWMTVAVGGIDTLSNATSTAWEEFVVAPNAMAVASLQTSSYQLETRFGHTALTWALDSDSNELTLNVTVPIGSTAHLQPPNALPGGLSLRRVAVAQTGLQLWEAPEGETQAAVAPQRVGSLGAGRHSVVVLYSRSA